MKKLSQKDIRWVTPAENLKSGSTLGEPTAAELKELYTNYPAPKLAEMYNVHTGTVKRWLSRYGIRREGTRSRIWNDARDAYLKKHYDTTANETIAGALGVSLDSVTQRAHRLGFKKSAAYLEELARNRKTLFKKGNVPWCKGMDLKHLMTDEQRATQFKPGGLPPNTREDGAITIRKDSKGRYYRRIRMMKNVWVFYSRYVWEQAHGKIPKGMMIVHRNGDTLDDRLENLDMVSMKENWKRNSASERLTDGFVVHTLATRKHPELKEAILNHPELIELKREQLKLQRQLKTASKNDNDNNPAKH